MKAVDAAVMRRLDELAVKRCGMASLQLMENAGRAVADVVVREVSACRMRCSVAVLAGKGNNGGDGFVAARHIMNAGVDVSVYAVMPSRLLAGDAAFNAAVWRKMGGRVVEAADSRSFKAALRSIRAAGVVVDAIFGSGLKGEVTGHVAAVIDAVNSLGKKIIAVDVPSGIDATTGALPGRAVRADITVTLALAKTGLFIYPGREMAGEIEVAPIGMPSSLFDDPSVRWRVTDIEEAASGVRRRRPDSHKGNGGHVLVIAGSAGKTGAAHMAALGALRSGAGLATVALPASLLAALEAKTREVMGLPLADDGTGKLSSVSKAALASALKGKRSVVIGPGLGTGEAVFDLIRAVASRRGMMVVIDADGLNALAGRAGTLKGSAAEIVITPHPAEAARMLGCKTAEVQADRLKAAGRLAALTGAVAVLKGAGTIIASPDGRVSINPTGNPCLATAGTGDVLAGMTGALLASGAPIYEAAVAAVYCHGLAADIYAAEHGAGMVATDLLKYLPSALREVGRVHGP